MPPIRQLPFVAALAITLALPASAGAKLEFNLPAQIVKELDDSGATANDPGRCAASAFVEFPKIKHAVSYRVVVKRRAYNGQLFDYVAPPFDTWGRGFIARYPPPKGFARFFVFAASGGDGCPAVDARTEGEAEIVSAKVSLDKPFQKRFHKVDKKPWKCAYAPGERTVVLDRGGDPRLIVVRKQGHVTTTDKGSQDPLNLMTNRYASAGTIVKTGHNSFVKIGGFGGGSALVGPDTTVRLTDKGFEILEQPRHPRFKVEHKPGEQKVRTCSAVISARG
jgi:hypothetical protein